MYNDTLFRVLLYSDIEDIKSICISNKYTLNNLCNSMYFWEQKFKLDNLYLPNYKPINFKEWYEAYNIGKKINYYLETLHLHKFKSITINNNDIIKCQGNIIKKLIISIDLSFDDFKKRNNVEYFLMYADDDFMIKITINDLKHMGMNHDNAVILFNKIQEFKDNPSYKLTYYLYNGDIINKKLSLNELINYLYTIIRINELKLID